MRVLIANGQVQVLGAAPRHETSVFGRTTWPPPTSTPDPPVTQEVIGTTGDFPVYVRVDQGGLGPVATPLLTVAFAIVTALLAQLFAHHMAVRRERENRYLAALAPVLAVAGEVNTAMSNVDAEYREVLNAATPNVAAYTKAVAEYAASANALDAAAVAFEIWSSAGDRVLKEIDALEPSVRAFLDEANKRPLSQAGYKDLDRAHHEFVEQLRTMSKAATLLHVGASPPVRRR
ncbi:MAG: hypothetical protein J7513_13265 [Solirubrobacteraceae bacterium]|nr:hypothetical protein [Solirubrobacteraceae bacterium]